MTAREEYPRGDGPRVQRTPRRSDRARGPRQASLRRLQQFAIRPNRELGQNFLVDDNILTVIGALAELRPDDVVLEVGGGLGVLSEYLAQRVRHVHVVEVDRSLASALADALAPHSNSSLHLVDALRLDLAALEPPVGKVVANLPYGVAATVILKSIAELPRASLWVAMLQREVAERLAAPPGSKLYGATSVIAQLSCEVRVDRKVGGSAFYPVPNVESALCVLRRRAPTPPGGGATRYRLASGEGAPGSRPRGAAVAEPQAGRTPVDRGELVSLVHAAFGHRRKTLAGSIALAPGAPADIREAARSALERIGRPPDTRAEALSPGEFEALASELRGRVLEALERAAAPRVARRRAPADA